MYKIKFYFKNNNALISNYYVDFNRNLIYRNYNILEKIFNKKKLNNYNANKGKDYFCILNNERDLINYIQNDVVRFNEGESSNYYSDKIQDIDYKKINYNPMKYMTNGKTPLIVNDTIMKTVKFKTNEGNYDEFTGKWEGKAFWGPHWDYDITLNIRKEDNNKYSVIVSSFYDFKDKIYTDTGERYFGRGKVIYECSGSFNKETSEFILEAPNKTIKKTGCFNNEKFHFKDDYNSSKTLKYDRKNNTFEIQYDYFLTKVSK